MSMHRSLSELETLQSSLLASGAAQLDAVAWHYIEALSARTRQHAGPTQDLLCRKLEQALTRFEDRLGSAPKTHATDAAVLAKSKPSPLAALLSDIRPHVPNANIPYGNDGPSESPHVRQFRKKLGQISVQKKVSQAIAQAPQNAGPINSHMLVLRSLSLMRDVSPDYLNRFMTYVDTLLCLDETGNTRLKARTASAPNPKK